MRSRRWRLSGNTAQGIRQQSLKQLTQSLATTQSQWSRQILPPLEDFCVNPFISYSLHRCHIFLLKMFASDLKHLHGHYSAPTAIIVLLRSSQSSYGHHSAPTAIIMLSWLSQCFYSYHSAPKTIIVLLWPPQCSTVVTMLPRLPQCSRGHHSAPTVITMLPWPLPHASLIPPFFFLFRNSLETPLWGSPRIPTSLNLSGQIWFSVYTPATLR